MQRPRWLPVQSESLDAAPPLAWVVWDAGRSWAVSNGGDYIWVALGVRRRWDILRMD